MVFKGLPDLESGPFGPDLQKIMCLYQASFVTASPSFHSFNSFFHLVSCFSCSADNPASALRIASMNRSRGSFPVWLAIPLASSAQVKHCLYITQFDLDTSSLELITQFCTDGHDVKELVTLWIDKWIGIWLVWLARLVLLFSSLLKI